MKKLRFLKACHDKNTKENYVPGFIKEFEDERADEILEVEGYAEEVYENETETEDGKSEEETAGSGETKTEKEEEKKPEEKKGERKDK